MTGDEVSRRLNGAARNGTGETQRAAHLPDESIVTDNKGGALGGQGSRALLARYLVIGGLSAVIDVSLLFTLHSIVGVQLSIATAVAFLVSLFINFVGNRLTIAGREKDQLMRHASRYGLLVVANLGITVAGVTGAEHIGVPYVVGKLAVVAASTCWNFVLYRRWVFTQSERRAS
jgi:putative flippase GtrA